MKCPRCGAQQPDSPECVRCGVVIRKFLERQGVTQPVAPAPAAGEPARRLGSRTPDAGVPTAPGVLLNAQARSRPKAQALLLGWWRTLMVVLFPPFYTLRQFYGALQRMLRAGAGIDVAMQALAEQGWGRFGRLARGLAEGLAKGKSMADSLFLTGLVPELHAGLLAAGEQLGSLPDMLALLVDQCQSRLDVRTQIIKASLYPMLLVVLSAFMMPIPTLVLGTGNAYAREVMGLLAKAAAGIAVLFVLLRLLPFLLGGLLHRLPGGVERWLFPGRRAQSLWVLHSALKAGVPWTQALDLAGKCFLSKDNRRLFERAYQGLQRGESMVQALSPLVDRGFRVLLVSGELSGSLEDVFRELHDEYAVRARRRVTMGTALVSALILLGALAYVAGQTFSGLESAFTIPTEQLEQLNRELKGTGIQLF